MSSRGQIVRVLLDHRAIGVDEVACLIDFGVPADDALAALHHLNQLREAWQAPLPETEEEEEE